MGACLHPGLLKIAFLKKSFPEASGHKVMRAVKRSLLHSQLLLLVFRWCGTYAFFKQARKGSDAFKTYFKANFCYGHARFQKR